MSKEYGMLVIHTNRQTDKYEKFEIYPRECEKDIVLKIEEWNKNDSNKTLVKLYDDPLLVDLAGDIKASKTNDALISSLRSITRDICNSIDELNSWTDDIENQLNEIKEQAK